MLTLTIDRSLFDAPEQAYEWVIKKMKLSRLVKQLDEREQLHSRRYFAAMELQGGGWPHWHVLLDASYVDIIVVGKILRYWVPRDKRTQAWKYGDQVIGHPYASERSVVSAAAYLSKPSEQPAPEWILKRGGDARRVRFTSASQGLTKSASAQVAHPSKQGPPRRPRMRRGPTAGRTYGERQDLCRREISLFETLPASVNEEVANRRGPFVATLSLTQNQSEVLGSIMKHTPAGIQVDTDCVIDLIATLQVQTGEPVAVQYVSKAYAAILATMIDLSDAG